MLLISLITGFFLISVTGLQQTAFQLFLVVTFGIVVVASFRKLDLAYFGLLFILPLVPSIPSQVSLPSFDLEQFLLLSFLFSWSLKKGLVRDMSWSRIPLATPLLVLLLYFGLSAALAMLRYNLVATDIFVLKVKEHWNVFLPWSALDDTAALRSLLTVAEAVLFYFITVDLLNEKPKIEKAIRIFFYSACCVAFLGVLQIIFDFRLLYQWLHDNMGLSRINATFPDPNSLGVYLAAAFIIGGYAIFPTRKRSTFILLILIGGALFLTGSRSSWTALVVVALLFPLFAKRLRCDPTPHLNKTPGLILKYGYVLVFALMVLASIKVTFFSLPAKPTSLKHSVHYTRWNRALEGRVGVWQGGFRMFKADPIYGNGLGTFPRTIGKYKDVVPRFFRKENAHNYYLQLLAETGIVGLFLFVFLAFSIVRRAIQFLQNVSERQQFLPAYGLLSGILIFLVSSLAQHPLLLLKMQLVFWLLVGIFFAVIRLAATAPAKHSRSRTFWATIALVVLGYLPFQVYSILQAREVPPYEYGFYEWQESGKDRFRITKRQTVSLLRVEGKTLAMEMAPLKLPAREKRAAVEIYINEQFLNRILFTNKEWQTISLDVSQYRPNELIRLEMTSPTPGFRWLVRPFQWQVRE